MARGKTQAPPAQRIVSLTVVSGCEVSLTVSLDGHAPGVAVASSTAAPATEVLLQRPLLQVAPMIDVTNRHFRMLIRCISDLPVLWTEMTWDRAILYNTPDQPEFALKKVCHAGLEPRTSRHQAGLLLTRASLALDRRTSTAPSRASSASVRRSGPWSSSWAAATRTCSRVCHGALEPQTSRPQVSPLPTRLSLALDRLGPAGGAARLRRDQPQLRLPGGDARPLGAQHSSTRTPMHLICTHCVLTVYSLCTHCLLAVYSATTTARG